MKIKGNDIHLTQRELLTAALEYVRTHSVVGQNTVDSVTVDDVYGIAAPVRIEGERHDYIISIKEEGAEPVVA